MPGPYIIDDNDVPGTACQYAMFHKVVRDFDGHFHCVYEKYVTVDIVRSHVFYSRSEDGGLTWTPPVDLTLNAAYDALESNIVVDSSGTIHVIYVHKQPGFSYGYMEYLYRLPDEPWSTPLTIARGFAISNKTPGNFTVGEIVEGDDSGATRQVHEGYTSILVPLRWTGHGSFIINEWIQGADSGVRARYQGEATTHFLAPSLAIDSGDWLHIAVGIGGRVRYFRGAGKGSFFTYQDTVGLTSSPSSVVPIIGIGPNNRVHITARRVKVYYYFQGSWGGWTSVQTFCTGTSNHKNFSMAVDLSRNVHVALFQTGLGGAGPGTLNIKYYKRDTGGTWTGPEHVTEGGTECTEPTIAVDKNGIITVVFLSRLGGLGNDAIFMRQKIGGSWSSIETLIERTFREQEEINLLHSLWPAKGSFVPNHPDGYAFIFNGYIDAVPAYYTVEFYHDMAMALGWPPTDLWCEQKTNPNDVEDPNPEFSAIYHETK